MLSPLGIHKRSIHCALSNCTWKGPREDYQRHFNFHATEDRYYCLRCDFWYKNALQYHKHLKTAKHTMSTQAQQEICTTESYITGIPKISIPFINCM